MTADPPPPAAPDSGDDRAKAQPDPKAAPTEAGADTSASGPTLRGSGGESSDDQLAFVRGRQSLRPDVTFISGGPDQNVQFGNRYYFQSSRHVAPNPGPVRSAVLKEICGRYVRVPGYASMYDALENRRLLVLVGPPASGRSTTALHLLNELSPGAVERLDPATDMCALDETSISRRRGYLGELNGSTAQPTQAQADRLASLLELQESFCVLVATPTSTVQRVFGDYRAPCSPPPIDDLLSAHLDAELRSEDPPNARDRLTELAKDYRVREAHGPDPRPSEVAELARLLVAHVRGEIESEDGVIRAVSAFLDRRIADWFAELQEPARREGTERTLRRAALRIALAVFDDLPRHFATTAGAELGDLLIQAWAPKLVPGRPVVAGDDDALVLALLHAEAVVDEVRYGGVAVPAEILRYRDRRTPTVLLTHVWLRQSSLRPSIVKWLDTLAVHHQQAVRIRAALAAGLLCSVDFTYTFPLLVEPAATAMPRRTPAGDGDARNGEAEEAADPDQRWELRRRFAAVALDQAARDERLGKVVEATLKRWRRSSDPALRWAAAMALGYEVGLRAIEQTLDELRIIGTPQELEDVANLAPFARTQTWDLVWVAGLSIARLFANGAQHIVLEYLLYWLRHPRRSLRQLALQAIVLIADLKMSIVIAPSGSIAGKSGHERPPGWERWPIVLGLTEQEPDITVDLAAVLRCALHGEASNLMADSLTSWMRLGQSDARVLDALVAFLPWLVVDDVDRCAVRSAISDARRRWADPLRADVADCLKAAIADTSSREE